MNSPETQFDSSSQDSYFDPEAMDTSEQEFSASLEASPHSSFVIDSSERSAGTPERSNSAEGVDSPEHVGRRASRPSISAIDDAGLASPNLADLAEIPSDESSPTDWRDQVSAKVKHYKTLK